MSKDNLNICLLQANLTWEKKEINLATFEQMILALKNPADIILLPEMFTTGFSMNPESLAECMDGPSVKWMLDKAQKTGSLIAGSLIIKEKSDYFNRFIAMSPDGIIASYDKRHLFRMSNEEAHYEPGIARITFEWRGWRILPQICYDLRFPVWIRNQDDYDLMLLVANWPEPRRDVWRTLLLARALENQAYVAGLNRTGRDNKMVNHAGDSLIISPKGDVIKDFGSNEGSFYADLSKNELIEFREKFPVNLDQDTFSVEL
ncbi:MAG: amidohydrolase [Bacteroidota bacterium]|nr:amidohydrolase [Bacteroidota bacterium]